MPDRIVRSEQATGLSTWWSPTMARASRTDLVPKLFTRFARGHAHGAGGTGLGLYISRNLLEAQGGEIGYAGSQTGSRFTVRLPAAGSASVRPTGVVGRWLPFEGLCRYSPGAATRLRNTHDRIS